MNLAEVEEGVSDAGRFLQYFFVDWKNETAVAVVQDVLGKSWGCMPVVLAANIFNGTGLLSVIS